MDTGNGSMNSWLAVVVMVLHFLGPIVKSWSDAAIAKWMGAKASPSGDQKP